MTPLKQLSTPEYSKKQLKIILSLGIALILAFLLDNITLHLLQQIKHRFLDFLFTYITQFTFVVMIALILPTIWFWYDKLEKKIIPLWLSFVSAGAIGYIIKIMVQRQRPTEEFLALVNTSSSFPSLHAATAFSVIPLLALVYPQYAKYFIIFGILIGITRMYFGLHYLSDIIGGILLGYSIGYGVTYLYKKQEVF